MNKYPSIEQLRHVVAAVTHKTRYVSEGVYNNDPLPTLPFTGTIKLHGSNGGVVVNKDGIHAQSRNQLLTEQNDNYGFYQFVLAQRDVFTKIAWSFLWEEEIVIYGEWAGKNINAGGTGISRLPRAFYIFDVLIDGKWLDKNSLFILGHSLAGLAPDDVRFITNYPTYQISLDFNTLNASSPIIEDLTKIVNEIDAQCPVAAHHDVEGHGEGLVFANYDMGELLAFKLKGDSHKIARQKVVVELSPEFQASIDEFCDYSLTLERLNQIYGMVSDKTNRGIGEFLKLLSLEIIKEESDVLEESGLEWKHVSRAITHRAKEFFGSQ